MEWNKIESKWNEMAGRLQNNTRLSRRTTSVQIRIISPDAVTQPVKRTETDAAATDAGGIAIRSGN